MNIRIIQSMLSRILLGAGAVLLLPLLLSLYYGGPVLSFLIPALLSLVYFKINSNGFTYTTDDQKPEILLTITNPAGQAVTSIEGLTYKSNVTTTTSSGTQTVSGFDITNKTGTFAIASEYPITSNSSTSFTTQNWTITATFINLDTDQQANAGQTMNAEIIIQKV